MSPCYSQDFRLGFCMHVSTVRYQTISATAAYLLFIQLIDRPRYIRPEYSITQIRLYAGF